jgi:hypothetical protein
MDRRRRGHGTAVELGGPARRGGGMGPGQIRWKPWRFGPVTCFQKEVKGYWAWRIRPVCLPEIPAHPTPTMTCGQGRAVALSRRAFQLLAGFDER